MSCLRAWLGRRWLDNSVPSLAPRPRSPRCPRRRGSQLWPWASSCDRPGCSRRWCRNRRSPSRTRLSTEEKSTDQAVHRIISWSSCGKGLLDLLVIRLLLSSSVLNVKLVNHCLLLIMAHFTNSPRNLWQLLAQHPNCCCQTRGKPPLSRSQEWGWA